MVLNTPLEFHREGDFRKKWTPLHVFFKDIEGRFQNTLSDKHHPVVASVRRILHTVQLF